ncbi:MAG: alpha/beta hydrolase, partial [Lentisphaerales bacterium]|nr:alpha/beta hydrolase [Lentisphaerales bacterium]
GHSMGSASTAWFTAKYPNIARAIILEDPRLAPRPASWVKRYEPANIQKRRSSILKKNNSTYEEIYTRGLQNTPQWGESELRYWAPSKLLHHPNSAFRKIGKHPKMAELFPLITIPTLILKADDRGQKRQTNLKISKLLLRGKIIHIKGAGHNVRRDQKELTIEAVKRFLNTEI